MYISRENNKKEWRKYCQQASYVKRRAPDRTGAKIEFRLAFKEWLSIWQQSGKLHLRGRGAGRYVMARKDDLGHYALGNVEIKRWEENSAEARRGRPVQDSTRQKMRAARAGVPKSAESNRKRSEAMRSQEAVTCPHCGKRGQKAAMSRYHFDRCAQRSP